MVELDCVSHALEAYLRRSSEDTNPLIERLLLPDGTQDSHWYYRSDQVISTSAFNWPEDFPAYEGPLEGLPRPIQEQLAPGRYILEPFLMDRVNTTLKRHP